MKVMNSVMESAILQNMTAHVSYSQRHNALEVSITNQSPIQLSGTKINTQIRPNNDDNHAITIFQRHVEIWKANESFQFKIQLLSSPMSTQCFDSINGDIVIDLVSPGTQLMLTKKEKFRISFLERLKFIVVVDHGAAGATMNKKMLYSRLLRVSSLRKLLNLSPYDALVTSTQGFYNIEWEENQQENSPPDAFCLNLLVIRQSTDHGDSCSEAIVAVYNNQTKDAVGNSDTAAAQIVREFENVAT